MNPSVGQSFLARHHRILFYSAWLILNLIQSGFTQLQDDEAYYWVYSKFPAWGYFDHPPMIALLIKAGYAIIPNELGVRLFPLLLNTLTLVVIEKLISNKNPFLFYAIALSMAVLQLSGFVAVPDIPLIFFSALFFLNYKRFLANPNFLNTFFLGLCIALLFYSKYHALLIVIFTLASNLKILRRYQTWIAGLIAFILFLPHLSWQEQHDWVSFRYHLFENHVNPYKPSFTLDYLLGQFLMPGPIAGLILLPAALLYKPKEPLEKALKYTMVGVYLFFLASSLRGDVEANWTAPGLIGLVVLSHQFLADKIRWRQWLFRLLPITIVLVFLARIIMIFDIVPVFIVKQNYHSWKDWPAEMRERTKGLPVVVNNSYQRASKYWFYTGQMAYSQNWYRERKNNFNYWPVEDSLLGKPVYILDIFEVQRFRDSLKTPLGWMGYQYNPVHNSFVKVQISTVWNTIRTRVNDSLFLTTNTSVPLHYEQYIKANNVYAEIFIGVFGKDGFIKDIYLPHSLQEMIQRKPVKMKIAHGLPAGKYYFRFAVNVPGTIPTHNSDKIDLIVK